jgi:hypothetical protein
MPLVQSFSSSQTIGNESVVTITDTSSGSDGTITSRRVYLTKMDGSYLVPDGTSTDYIEWDINDTSIDIDCLDKDYALQIVVHWLNVTPSVVYSASELTILSLYTRTFLYQLTQRQTGNPVLVNDGDYFINKSELQTELDSAIQAIELASDQTGAQLCLDRATEIRINATYLF